MRLAWKSAIAWCFYVGDVRDYNSMRDAMSGVDFLSSSGHSIEAGSVV